MPSTEPSRKVIIVGGGVAGLSAAHELAERGFTVEVYERRMVPGGKARSIQVPGATEGRGALPGEHGFRFFPGFYCHLPDTMKRIPVGNDGQTVFDNLVPTTRIEFARPGSPPMILLPRLPHSLDDFKTMMQGVITAEHMELGLTVADLEFFAERMWQIMTSCQERRIAEYERIGWWYFLDAPNRSKAYQDYLGEGLTRSLVAAKAKLASTKTVGDIGLQLVLNLVEPGFDSDRVLNGPTNQVWIQPWLDYLTTLGVRYNTGCNVTAIGCQGKQITGITITDAEGERVVTGDYYIIATPVEVTAALLNDPMIAADPTLEGIKSLSSMVAWMNGIQFYLREEVDLVRGHQIYLDSPWALTSLSQLQFWPSVDPVNLGDGGVRSIISVDISEWNVPGLNGKLAIDCTHQEIAEEVWAQLKATLNVNGQQVLSDYHSWFLDPDIVSLEHTDRQEANLEPLLVNLVGTWQLRPDARTAIGNLFLAGDYVRTWTDLATMEGANESARRAVNCILDAEGDHNYCDVWQLHEPLLLAPWRKHDQTRFERGLPWNGTLLH